MSYLDRIATETPAALIAAEAPTCIARIKHHTPTTASKFTTYAQARKNRAYVEATTEELRNIWRLANRGDEAWRGALAQFAAKHAKVDALTTKRFALIAERCGVEVPA